MKNRDMDNSIYPTNVDNIQLDDLKEKEEVWWLEYRRRPRIPKKISIKRIMWKTLLDVYNEYLSQSSLPFVRNSLNEYKTLKFR